jgi:hypothetical protein
MEKIEKLKTFLNNSPEDSFLKHALVMEYINLGNESMATQLFLEITRIIPI